MKETIYTIPVNDAFDKESECALCELEKDLENSNIEYTTGAALMEPNVRIQMNEKGFCKKHYSNLLTSQKNALGISLILTSHHETIMGEIDKKISKKYIDLEKSQKQKTRTKLAQEISNDLIEILSNDAATCFICDRIVFTMDKYLDVVIYMWDTNDHFRTGFIKSKGFCNKHTALLLEYGKNKLKNDKFDKFVSDVYMLFITNWKRNEEDLRWFTQKFDYRFKNEPWKDSKDALPRVVGKIVGFTD